MESLIRLMCACAVAALIAEGGFVIWAMSRAPDRSTITIPDATADEGVDPEGELRIFRDSIFERTHRADAGYDTEDASTADDLCPDCWEHPDEPL